MGVPRVYRKEDERAIATYAFTAIASGLGYENFFMNIFSNQADEETTVLIDADIRTPSLSIDNATTATLDTSTFNLPRTIQGDVYFIFTMSAPGVGDYHTVSLFHVAADNTETQIGSSFSTEDNTASVGGIITVTKQIFGVGSKLRLKLLAISNNTISDLILTVPFRVDL